MTLTSHAIVGATVASLMPQHPVLGFCAAFASHFVIDAIPHWDYPIASGSIDPLIGATMKYDKALLVDILKIGTDMSLGIFLALFFLSGVRPLAAVLLGACAGILPDPLQFVYTRFRHEPLVSLQHFHEWAHTKNHLEKAKFVGIISQVILVATVIVIGRLRA
jgi:hypothetical protein